MREAPRHRPPSAAEILAETFRLFRLAPHRAVVAFALMGGLGTAVDAGLVADDGAVAALNLAISVFVTVMQFWIVRSLLQDLGNRLPARPRFPAFFLMVIVTTLGILLGLVALVVPGIVLIVRWSIATPVLLGSERRVFEAIGDSWRATEGSFLPILLAFLAIFGAAALLAAAGFALETALQDNLAGAAFLNLGINGGIIAGWHAAVAIYVRLRGPDRVTEIFE